MEPCYPSKTFPNHYTIATGMYPDHHGLVDNSFRDLAKNAVYSIGKREMVEDGSWYGGTPLWVLAEQAGHRTASFFFVGSEADIQGIRPTHYRRYDAGISNQDRVRQALDWLSLPGKERPRLITMYFSDMDDTGHRYGPDDDIRLAATLEKLDETLGMLFDGIKALPVPVNVVIVSDHGMQSVPVAGLIPVEKLQAREDERYELVNNGALVHLYLSDKADVGRVSARLKETAAHYQIYATREVPYFDVSPDNPRWGDIIVVPDSGHYFAGARVMAMRKASGQAVVGEHGFDTRRLDMHGIFYAKGPDIRQGLVLPTFKNIHVYPFVCRLLGLQVPANVDGDPAVLAPALR
jgi:predicted AlkP superfamily pyrophosphatase or phosphodiesterase